METTDENTMENAVNNPESQNRLTNRGAYSSDIIWTKEKTLQLIQLFESHPELWNTNEAGYKDRIYKRSIQTKIAALLAVEVKDVAAKMHNLRCQYNAEIRKIRQKNPHKKTHIPRWEFFKALYFLSSTRRKAKNPKFPVEIKYTKKKPLKQKIEDPSSSNSNADDSCEPIHLEPTVYMEEPTIHLLEHTNPMTKDVQMENVSQSSIFTPNESFEMTCKQNQEEMLQNYEQNRHNDHNRNELLEMACKQIQQHNDESYILGRGWSFQYSALTEDQKVFAKKAIDDIFFEAKLGTLHRHSVKINKSAQCKNHSKNEKTICEIEYIDEESGEQCSFIKKELILDDSVLLES